MFFFTIEYCVKTFFQVIIIWFLYSVKGQNIHAKLTTGVWVELSIYFIQIDGGCFFGRLFGAFAPIIMKLPYCEFGGHELLRLVTS